MGIRALLAIGLAGLLLAAGTIAGVVVVQLVGGETEARLIQQYDRRGVGVARQVEAACRDMTICVPQLSRILAADPGRDGIREAAVFDGRLERLAGSAALAPGHEVGEVQQGARSAQRTVLGDAEHRIAQAVRLGDGRRAILALRFSFAGLREAVQARQRAVLLFILADLLVILLFGIYLGGRYLVRPIQALTAAAADAARGAPVPLQTSPAEVARLSEAFRALVAELQARNAELAATVEALEATRDELVRAERLATVGRLAAGLAHEIGNPLAAVLGYVEYLRADEPVPATLQANLLGRMDKELGRIRDTLRGLLDFSRPATGAPARVDPREATAAAIELTRFQRAFREVEVALTGEACRVLIDPGRLRQVIVNLLMNAAEAGAGQISCVWRLEGAGAQLDVQDDGPGVSAAVAERIFDPFMTTRPVGEGTGLGLPISQRIIEEARGRLWLHPPAPGQGARLSLWLPAAEEADEAEGEAVEQIGAEEQRLERREGEERPEGDHEA